MTLDQIHNALHSNEYDFLRQNPNLGNNVILLGLGGSHSYGTNMETSDLDVRGIAVSSSSDILLSRDFEQVVNVATDTTVYSLRKAITLLCNCNPNVIEILGLRDEHYLYLSSYGKMLLDNKHAFLSKKAIYSFGGYATAQLKRLENKSNRLVEHSKMEKHILATINDASFSFKQKYFGMPDDAIRLYVDKTTREDYDTEIFMDVVLNHYPLRDFKDMWAEMHSIVKSYGKIGKRNEKAIEHNKLGKHMMHLIRLYLMCLDILEREEIKTYRDEEHDFLMSIRNGAFLDDNMQPIPEFYELLNEYEKRLDYAKANTSLPDEPDYKTINDMLISIHHDIVCKGAG